MRYSVTRRNHGKNRMNRYISALLIAVVLFLSASGLSFAQEPFIVQPGSLHLGELKPGDIVEGSLQVTNRGQQAAHIEVSAEKRLITGKIGDALTFQPSTLEIPPGKSMTVAYKVTIARDTDAGEYIFGLVFTATAKVEEVLQEGSRVIAATAVEVPLSFTVSGSKVQFLVVKDIQLGEELRLRAIIWNFEDEEFSTKVEFDLFDDQRTLLESWASSEEMLKPGNSRSVTFSKDTAEIGMGDYLAVGRVYRDGEEFRKVENYFRVGLVKFVLSGLTITPDRVLVGEAIVISANVENIGNIEGTYTVTLIINDIVEATERVTVAGGETKTVTFTIAKAEQGIYNVAIDELKGTFTVVIPIPWSMILIVLGITALLIVLTIGLLWLRKRFHFRVERK